jgi:T-complex protein 1 subunit eta
MDKLMVDSRGEVTISNDGATIMKLLDIVHPAAKTLVDIARSQDAEVPEKKIFYAPFCCLFFLLV